MSSIVARSSASPSLLQRRQALPVRSARVGPSRVPVRRGDLLTVRADDFDTILAKVADKFEKSPNKTAIIGYTAAAAGALVFSEWLIHLPVLNFLLGGSVQLLGLLLLPYLGVRYLVDNEDVTKDISGGVERIAKLLPGLDK